MTYKSIDNVGVRQLRNRLNNLRDYVNDNELNRNIEQVNPNEAEERNEQLNLDRLQDRNDEVIFPAAPMDNHEQNDRQVLFRLGEMELLDDELDASDDGSNDEDILEAGVNNDDHYDSYDDDNVTENEDDNDNEDDPNYEDNNRNRQHNNIHQQQPLYNGSQITVGDSMLIILSLLLRHNLTMVCIEDIIKAIELHCLQDGLKKNSLYKFKKYFQLDETTNTKKHYYCKVCVRELDHQNDECPSCEEKKNSYFVQLSMTGQLKEMYRRQGFYEKLQWKFRRPVPPPGIITDIYDAELYREWCYNGFLSNPDNVSFSWYTDGVPVYKSSHISIWPFYLTINELPFEERKKRENTLLLGYWFDDKKLIINNFIYKFREELQEIAQGVAVDLPGNIQRIVRGVMLMGVCDQPAKGDCFNFVQYNGDYGCTSCLSKGELLHTDAGGHVHVYPHELQIHPRTSGQTVAYANLATPGEPVMGVKGNSALFLIMPDFIRGTAIDRMHCSDSGVIKKILTLLFDAAYSNDVFSLRAVMDQIDHRLISIKPPKFIHRMPRSINDLKHWKASEFKVFCFYYALPIFEGIMRFDYFQHLLKLICGLYILSCDAIDVNMIEVARDLLNCFARDFEQLYGLRYCSINIHLLIHLPDSVKNLGPLWAHTCYESEDLNGQLLKLLHGTWHIDSQLARSQSQFITMTRFIELSANENVRNFCQNKKVHSKILDQISDNCYSVGNYKCLDNEDIPLIIMLAMQRSELLMDNITIRLYFRLIKNNKVYVSEMYKDNMQTQSSVVQYLKNGQL